MKTATTVICIVLYMVISSTSYATPVNCIEAKRCLQSQQSKNTLAPEIQSVAEKFAIAMSLERKYKYKEAFKIYLSLAESGNAGAQFNVAVMYRYGVGVPVNYERSFHWYEKAALQGHTMSQHDLGVLHMKGEGGARDPKKGFYWTERSAKSGNKLAQYHLAILYTLGDGINKDHNKAFIWHEKAADQGVVVSQYYVAWYFCIGFEAAPKNLKTCAKWAKKAQENGSKRAAKLWERYELWKFY